MVKDKWLEQKFYSYEEKIAFVRDLFEEAELDRKGITLEVPRTYFSEKTIEGEYITLFTLGTESIATIKSHQYDKLCDIYNDNIDNIDESEFSLNYSKGARGVIHFIEELKFHTDLPAEPRGTIPLTNEHVRKNSKKVKYSYFPDLLIGDKKYALIEVKFISEVYPEFHIKESSWDDAHMSGYAQYYLAENKKQRTGEDHSIKPTPSYLAIVTRQNSTTQIRGLEILTMANMSGYNVEDGVIYVPSNHFERDSDFFETLEERLS